MAQDKYLFQTPIGIEDVDSSLQNFSNKDLDKIFELFNNGEKITNIRHQFSKISNQRFEDQLPYVLSDEKCEKCGGDVYYKYSRSNPYKPLYVYARFCSNCGHNFEPDCSCEYCEKEYKDVWIKYLDKNYKAPLKQDSLSIYDEMNLLLLTRYYLDRETGCIKISSSSSNNYYSYNNYSSVPDEFKSAVYSLINQQILIPCKDYNRHLVELRDDDTATVNTSWVPNVYWDLNLIDKDEPLTLIEFYNLIKDKEYSIKEKSLLWRDIYRDEVTQYIMQQSSEVLRMDIDDLLCDYITDLLIEDYSISQAFAQIYYAMSSSLRYLVKYKPTKQKVTSNFRNNVMRNAKRFNGKIAKSFNRPNYIDLSLLNELVIRTVLNVKGDYFYTKTKDVIPEYISLCPVEKEA